MPVQSPQVPTHDPRVFSADFNEGLTNGPMIRVRLTWLNKANLGLIIHCFEHVLLYKVLDAATVDGSEIANNHRLDV